MRGGGIDPAAAARRGLEGLHDEILVGVKRRIRECLGPQPKSIARYYRSYVRVFGGEFEPCRTAEVVRSALAARIVYAGDFHTNPAAQRAQQDLLEKMARGGRKVTLAVEMFAAEDQEKVDRYLSGELEERAFLRAVRYEQSWGFRWENFRALLRSAGSLGVPVVALNCKAGCTLAGRDEVSAAILARLLRENRDRSILVVYGDLHLAPSHLPAAVAAQAGGLDRPRTIVYQNSETIFRKLRALASERPVEAVRLDAEKFCLLNTPPLVKMQGYLSWLENSERLLGGEGPLSLRRAAAEPEEFEEDFGEVLGSIAGFLGLAAPDLDEWQLRVLDDVGFLDELPPRERGPISRLVRERRPVVVPGREVVYLPDTYLVTAAAAAMGILRRSASRDGRTDLYRSEAFARRVVERALEFLAAKLVHPALVGLRPHELLRLAERAHGAAVPRKLRRRFELARLLPEWIESLAAGLEPAPELAARVRDSDARLGFDVSRGAGEWLGEGLFERHQAGRLSIATLRDAISRRWTEEAAARAVAEWAAAIGD